MFDEHIFSTNDCIIIASFVVIFIIGVLGNTLVCYVFGKRKRRRRASTNRLLLYLGIVDLLASIFNPMMYIYWTATRYREWAFGDIGCSILPAIGPIMTTASAGLLLFIAIDRYRAIVTPFRNRLTLSVINFGFLAILVISIANYVHYKRSLTVSETQGCIIPDISDHWFSIPNCTLILMRLVLFTVIFVFTNVRVCSVLNAQKKDFTAEELCTKRHTQNRKVTKVLVTMGAVFATLVFPRELLHLAFNLSWIDNTDGMEYGPTIVSINSWLKLINSANSCANVFIYARMHSVYRAHVLRAMRCAKKLFYEKKEAIPMVHV